MTRPKLSVVIPAYNNAEFIDATVESVLGQDFDDFELIVADHSSTDGTAELLGKYASDPRVTLHTTPAGGGAPRNWQRVTAEATGEYIKLVCGDDLLYPGALSTQVEALDAHPSAVAVASRRDILDARGTRMIAGRGLQGLSGLVPGATAIRRTVRLGTNVFGEPMCVTLRRETLERVGGWDGRFPYLIDMASYTKVLFHGDLYALRDVVGGFRVSAGQWSVALVAEQARQAKAYHRWVAEQRPDDIGAADVWQGDRRAELTAIQRRLFYTVFRSRLNPR
ncbi:glycosyltransferase family 2 protein [Rhodococcus chondri]|uniref:Glycosyltransferase family 2 protein n=1 Tax=Rhodococcus chondri TaxID=3065941 RepID=A0ABU7JM96_9NOCA|nr:glycosyltransferase family 2 protein [Rhodococcus sp. CC-R104]MEE2031161.1 glycosyltransferase family 2 protein [Rhodococcus sp. CC-R104]